MLTGLKLSTFACKCVFQRPEQREDPMESNFEGLQVQNEIYQQIELKEYMRTMWLVIMFIPSVMVIKMGEVAHFMYFLLMKAKNQSQFGENI